MGTVLCIQELVERPYHLCKVWRIKTDMTFKEVHGTVDKVSPQMGRLAPVPRDLARVEVDNGAQCKCERITKLYDTINFVMVLDEALVVELLRFMRG